MSEISISKHYKGGKHVGFASPRPEAIGFTHGKAVPELNLDANRYQHVTREVDVRD